VLEQSVNSIAAVTMLNNTVRLKHSLY